MKKLLLAAVLVVTVLLSSAAHGLLADASEPSPVILGDPPDSLVRPGSKREPFTGERPSSPSAIPAAEYDEFIYLPGVFGAPLCSSTPQEEEIAYLAVTHPDQGRPIMNCHPILVQVARERALDMGVRNYFSHVNPDGYGPNYLVRQAGYKLPSWWGTDPELNYIESIAGGYRTPEEAWNAWLNSPAHRRHVLGEIDFFAGQTNFGIGHAYVPGSTYGHYWVFISAPPEE